jgi:ribulose-5-phosphate 4-epimerase/fuculose-1-phosphate aldolase
MATPVVLNPEVVRTFLRYARLVSARGYVHNTLGNIVLRVPHPDYPHGLAYTKHAELSLEEMEAENIVVTDIPTSRIVLGNRVTSIGHNLSREILRLRPDVHATIHVHDDALLAFFGSGAFREVRTISLDLPFVLGKPIHYVPAHVDVEADVGPVRDFIQETNAVVLLGHGVTTLGRNVSEAYHRLNSLAAEIRRNIAAELLAAHAGSRPQYRSEDEIRAMYRFAESIIYPRRAERVMQED